MMDVVTFEANARRASGLLKAMCNDRRLLILCHLATGEKSVGQLEALVGLSQSALSQHLARLRRDKIVATRREAQTIHYRILSAEAVAVMETLHGLYCGEPAMAELTDPVDDTQGD
jgi:DNA-binding transcriptional ArsR family regulator